MIELLVVAGLIGLIFAPRILKKSAAAINTVGAAASAAQGAVPADRWATIQKAVKIALILAVGVWIYWFWPETVPGKATAELIGLTPEDKWYPWVMQYSLLGLLTFAAWKMFTGGAKKTSGGSGDMAWVALIILGVVGTITIGAVHLLKPIVGERDHSVVYVKFPSQNAGASVTKSMLIATVAEIGMPRSNRNYVCKRIIEPKLLPFQPVWEGSGHGTESPRAWLSEDTKTQMRMRGYDRMTLLVEFRLVAPKPGVENPC